MSKNIPLNFLTILIPFLCVAGLAYALSHPPEKIMYQIDIDTKWCNENGGRIIGTLVHYNCVFPPTI